jgi:hypothetical protein
LRILFNEWSYGPTSHEYDWFTASHEAGHALAASLYASPPLGAVIYGEHNDYGLWGETFFLDDNLSMLSPHAMIAMTCAGAVAVSLLQAEPKGETSAFGCDCDYRFVADYLIECGLSLDDVRHAVFAVAAMLDIYRDELRALATALYEKKFLNAAEIKKVIGA